MNNLYLYSSSINNRAVKPAAHLMPRVKISDDLYRELSEKVRIEAENIDYYNDYTRTDTGMIVSAKIEVEAERDEVIYTLTTSALVTFRIEHSPCGRPLSSIDNISFLWVNLSAMTEFDGEAAHDFNIKYFKSLFTTN